MMLAVIAILATIFAVVFWDFVLQVWIEVLKTFVGIGVLAIMLLVVAVPIGLVIALLSYL